MAGWTYIWTVGVLAMAIGCDGAGSSDSGPDATACDSTLGTLDVHLVTAWGGGDYEGGTSIRIEPSDSDAFSVSIEGAHASAELEAGAYTVRMSENTEGCFSDPGFEVEIVACETTDLEMTVNCWGR